LHTKRKGQGERKKNWKLEWGGNKQIEAEKEKETRKKKATTKNR